MNISSTASTIGFIKAGRLRALASTGAKRGNALPELPTIAESGYPGFEAIQWYALVVPGGDAEEYRRAHQERDGEVDRHHQGRGDPPSIRCATHPASRRSVRATRLQC